MRRKPFTLCSAVSLLLCVASGVAWPLTYWRTLHVRRYIDESNRNRVQTQTLYLDADNGRLYLNATSKSYLRLSISGLDGLSIPASLTDRWGPYCWGNFSVSSRRSLRWNRWTYADRSDPSSTRPTWAGVKYTSNFNSGDTVAIPFLYVVVLTALLPAAWAGAYRRRCRRIARVREGAFPACGYDLRATPDRCPECGAAGTIPA